ncbi:hypothetical protein EVAR_42871_1 [Eumeta japonica]|uniref:Uncharacterized protein n=1 Tax=Eumeta variegata TaxID=151549 RepID=A0A4C1YHK2_EUMVA|nr:hypothetical protein EVAR_42871_1 [Eumeta japonica]
MLETSIIRALDEITPEKEQNSKALLPQEIQEAKEETVPKQQISKTNLLKLERQYRMTLRAAGVLPRDLPTETLWDKLDMKPWYIILLKDMLEKVRRMWEHEKAVENKSAPRPTNYAKAAAKPKIKGTGTALKIGPEPRTGPTHTLIIFKNNNHIASQMLGDGGGRTPNVRPPKRAKNQKVVLSCSSVEGIKKIEERI